jgi:hypothetical protein
LHEFRFNFRARRSQPSPMPISVDSAAPGSGGIASVSAWGYQRRAGSARLASRSYGAAFEVVEENRYVWPCLDQPNREQNDYAD